MLTFCRRLGLCAVLIGMTMPAFAAVPTETITVRDKRLSGTPIWFEQAYDVYSDLGPEFAKGLVIWNHPIGR